MSDHTEPNTCTFTQFYHDHDGLILMLGLLGIALLLLCLIFPLDCCSVRRGRSAIDYICTPERSSQERNTSSDDIEKGPVVVDVPSVIERMKPAKIREEKEFAPREEYDYIRENNLKEYNAWSKSTEKDLAH